MAKKKKKSGLKRPKIPFKAKKKSAAKKPLAKTQPAKAAPKKKGLKIPDFVSGVFVIVTDEGKRAMAPDCSFKESWYDKPVMQFSSKEAATTHLRLQQESAHESGIDDGVGSAVVAPMKQFLANYYDFDTDAMVLTAVTVPAGEPIVTAKNALKDAKAVLKSIAKDAAETLKATIRNCAAEQKDLAETLKARIHKCVAEQKELAKDHAKREKEAQKELADSEKMLAKFLAKAQSYGA